MNNTIRLFCSLIAIALCSAKNMLMFVFTGADSTLQFIAVPSTKIAEPKTETSFRESPQPSTSAVKNETNGSPSETSNHSHISDEGGGASELRHLHFAKNFGRQKAALRL